MNIFYYLFIWQLFKRLPACHFSCHYSCNNGGSDNAISFELNSFEFYRYIKMLILLPEFHFIYFSKKTYVRKKIEVYEQIMMVKLWQRQIFSNTYIEMDKRNSKSQWRYTHIQSWQFALLLTTWNELCYTVTHTGAPFSIATTF